MAGPSEHCVHLCISFFSPPTRTTVPDTAENAHEAGKARDRNEEMLFCLSLETTTTALEIYNSVCGYFAEQDIPMTNVISCAADGAPQ